MKDLAGWVVGVVVSLRNCVQHVQVRSQSGRFFRFVKDIWTDLFWNIRILKIFFQILFVWRLPWVSVSIINWSRERVWTLINDVRDHQWGVQLSTEKNFATTLHGIWSQGRPPLALTVKSVHVWCGLWTLIFSPAVFVVVGTIADEVGTMFMDSECEPKCDDTTGVCFWPGEKEGVGIGKVVWTGEKATKLPLAKTKKSNGKTLWKTTKYHISSTKRKYQLDWLAINTDDIWASHRIVAFKISYVLYEVILIACHKMSRSRQIAVCGAPYCRQMQSV
jgi:hypothetical protein